MAEVEKRKYSEAGIANDEDGDHDDDTHPLAKVKNTRNEHTLNDSVVVEMDIPRDRVASIIGSRGAVLNEIMSRTKCNIVINQDESQPRAIYTGTQQNIDQALALVSAVIVDGPLALTNIGTDIKTQEMLIHSSQAGRIMGPQGKTIKEIQQRCLVRMRIEEPTAGSDQRLVRFTGDAPKVKAAMDVTMQVLEMGSKFALSNFPTPLHVSSSESSTKPRKRGAEGRHSYPPREHVQRSAVLTVSAVYPSPPEVGSPLGADGSAGVLLTPTSHSDGIITQIAVLRGEVAGRVVGKSGTILELLRRKSGASVMADRSERGGRFENQCKIHMMGDSNSINLATKMIQELLINGPIRVNEMPDTPCSLPLGYVPPSSSSHPVQAYPVQYIPQQPMPSNHHHHQQQQQQHQSHQQLENQSPFIYPPLPPLPQYYEPPRMLSTYLPPPPMALYPGMMRLDPYGYFIPSYPPSGQHHIYASQMGREMPYPNYGGPIPMPPPSVPQNPKEEEDE